MPRAGTVPEMQIHPAPPALLIPRRKPSSTVTPFNSPVIGPAAAAGHHGGGSSTPGGRAPQAQAQHTSARPSSSVHPRRDPSVSYYAVGYGGNNPRGAEQLQSRQRSSAQQSFPSGPHPYLSPAAPPTNRPAPPPSRQHLNPGPPPDFSRALTPAPPNLPQRTSHSHVSNPSPPPPTNLIGQPWSSTRFHAPISPDVGRAHPANWPPIYAEPAPHVTRSLTLPAPSHAAFHNTQSQPLHAAVGSPPSPATVGRFINPPLPPGPHSQGPPAYFMGPGSGPPPQPQPQPQPQQQQQRRRQRRAQGPPPVSSADLLPVPMQTSAAAGLQPRPVPQATTRPHPYVPPVSHWNFNQRAVARGPPAVRDPATGT